MKTTTQADSILTEMGFALKVVSGPTGNVGENDWPNVSFVISLEYKGKQVIQTTYSMGVGCVEPKKTRVGSVNFLGFTVDEESLLMTWQSKPCANFQNKALWASLAAKLARSQKVIPQLSEVLHALLMDGEAFFNAQGFEDWCGEFGYDVDSRKAESIYRQCDSTGRKLSAGIPASVLEQVRNITRDL